MNDELWTDDDILNEIRDEAGKFAKSLGFDEVNILHRYAAAAKVSHRMRNDYETELAKLRAENERLRKANAKLLDGVRCALSGARSHSALRTILHGDGGKFDDDVVYYERIIAETDNLESESVDE